MGSPVLFSSGVESVMGVFYSTLGLCFGLVLETEMIMEMLSFCWAGCAESQSIFCTSHHPTSQGEHKEPGEGTAGAADHDWSETVQTSWCHAEHIKLGGEEEREIICVPSHRCMWWSSILGMEWLNTFLPLETGGGIPCFSLPMYVTFALPVQLSLAQPSSFPSFTLLILSPKPVGQSVHTAGLCGV